MSNFTRKMDAFTAELRKRDASDRRVARLLALLPSLVQYKEANILRGKVKNSDVVQSGGKPAKAWSEAAQLVAAIGNQALSKCFDKALRVARKGAGSTNIISDGVSDSTVVQINSADEININRRRKRRRWLR